MTFIAFTQFYLRDESNEIVQVAVGQTASSDVIWNATSNVAEALLEIKKETEDGKSTSIDNSSSEKYI